VRAEKSSATFNNKAVNEKKGGRENIQTRHPRKRIVSKGLRVSLLCQIGRATQKALGGVEVMIADATGELGALGKRENLQTHDDFG